MTHWNIALKARSALIIFLLLGNEASSCQAKIIIASQFGDRSCKRLVRLSPFDPSQLGGRSCARGDGHRAALLLLAFAGEQLHERVLSRWYLWSAKHPTARWVNSSGMHAQPRRLQGREHADTFQPPLNDRGRSSSNGHSNSIDTHGFHRRRSPGWQDTSPGNNNRQASEKAFAYWLGLLLQVLFVVYGTVCLFAELIVGGDGGGGMKGIPNAALCPYDPCWRSVRHPLLLGLTSQEADFGRRIIAASLAGSLIGVERWSPNRAAGVRAMASVSTAACLFTIASMFAFEGGTQTWDASRVSAALPQGVGFLGAAVIFKIGPDMKGFTTATSIWLSCVVGLLCGGAQYGTAFFAVAAIVTVLRSVADKQLLANFHVWESLRHPGVQHLAENSKKPQKSSFEGLVHTEANEEES